MRHWSAGKMCSGGRTISRVSTAHLLSDRLGISGHRRPFDARSGRRHRRRWLSWESTGAYDLSCALRLRLLKGRKYRAGTRNWAVRASRERARAGAGHQLLGESSTPCFGTGFLARLQHALLADEEALGVGHDLGTVFTKRLGDAL